jgi:hypothetical protein
MFHLGISCESCHREVGGVRQDPAATCFACHGKGVRGMIEGWKAGLHAWSSTTASDLRKVEEILGPELSPETRKRLDGVRASVGLVDVARGAHNILYSQEIFRKARTTLEEVLEKAGKKADLGTLALPKGENDCTSCHVGAERIEGLHESYPFPHAPHLGKANLACDDCHAQGTPHGKLDMPVQRCTECHHSDDDEDCSKCHAAAARFYAGEGLPGVASKPDPMQAQVPCSACHADRAAKDPVASVKKMCVECHEARYGPMLDEWVKEGTTLAALLAEQAASARVALLDGDRRAPGYAEARTIVSDAETLLESLEAGRFSHNPALARTAAELIKVRLARVPSLVQAPN